MSPLLWAGTARFAAGRRPYWRSTSGAIVLTLAPGARGARDLSSGHRVGFGMSKPDPAGGSLENILASIRRSLAEQSTDALGEDQAAAPADGQPDAEPALARQDGLAQRLATADAIEADQAHLREDDLSDLLDDHGDQPLDPVPASPASAPDVPLPASPQPADKDPLWFLSRRPEAEASEERGARCRGSRRASRNLRASRRRSQADATRDGAGIAAALLRLQRRGREAGHRHVYGPHCTGRRPHASAEGGAGNGVADAAGGPCSHTGTCPRTGAGKGGTQDRRPGTAACDRSCCVIEPASSIDTDRTESHRAGDGPTLPGRRGCGCRGVACSGRGDGHCCIAHGCIAHGCIAHGCIERQAQPRLGRAASCTGGRHGPGRHGAGYARP